jgi:calcium/calmodulin-dependent protein kinase I
VKKEGLTDEDKDALQVEIKILQEIRHPNIMSLVDHFEEPKMYYLVTELLEGGELFDRIVEKEYYTEKEARDLVKILLSAIKFIHDRNIVHRDLKPENLLLTSKNDDANIKIAGTVCSVSTVLPLLTSRLQVQCVSTVLPLLTSRLQVQCVVYPQYCRY